MPDQLELRVTGFLSLVVIRLGELNTQVCSLQMYIIYAVHFSGNIPESVTPNSPHFIELCLLTRKKLPLSWTIGACSTLCTIYKILSNRLWSPHGLPHFL